jgi:hypothetical protein
MYVSLRHIRIDSSGEDTIVVAASSLLTSAAPGYNMAGAGSRTSEPLQASVCLPLACLTTEGLIDI